MLSPALCVTGNLETDGYNTPMPRYFVQNFGCRATQADGAAIERQLAETGFQQGFSSTQADLVVLNTCTVTRAADQDARAAVRRIRRGNPDVKILVTGCYAQRAPEEIAALEGVTWVVGNSHKQQVAEIAATAFEIEGKRRKEKGKSGPAAGFVPLSVLADTRRPTADGRIFVSDIFAHTELLAAPVFEGAGERTRPNLKVQDGCDNRCSFCVIPYVRGQSRSLRLDEVVRQVDELVAAGYREVVLSGINLGRWGREFDETMRFEELVRAILDRTSLEKLRLSSVEPMDWSGELIAMVAQSPRIAKHAHLPLQSGSDAVLRRMHRKYRPWHYAERARKIREAMPDAAIGADVMVGFPGETDAEFEESRRFIEEMPFTYLHVFTYSARPGTPAAEMPRQVPSQVAHERNRALRELAVAKNRAFRQTMLGREVEAITLGRGGENWTEALTTNYLKLQIAKRHEANNWMRVRVNALTPDGLRGIALSAANPLPRQAEFAHQPAFAAHRLHAEQGAL